MDLLFFDTTPTYFEMDEWEDEELVRLAEVNTKQTWPTLRSELDDMHLVKYESVDGEVLQRTEITTEQKRILSLLKIPEPAKIWDFSLRKPQNP